jgi:hypothetical protein
MDSGFLALLLSGEARAVDVVVGVPFRRDPVGAFTTEVASGVATTADVEVRNRFRGALTASIPFHDLTDQSKWIVDVGLREWHDTFHRDDRVFGVAAHEPHADVGVQIGAGEGVRAYGAMGVGVIVSILTSTDWRTLAFPSPHTFLAGGVAFGGATTKGLVEIRMSPVLRDDAYTRETLVDGGSAAFVFSPGGAAVTVGAGLRFL